MAYTIPPNTRIEYDRDGTTMLFIKQSDGSSVTYDFAEFNDEDNVVPWTANDSPLGYRPGSSAVVLIFPQAMDITHIGQMSANGFVTSWSDDTEDGYDGTWTTISQVSTWGSTSAEWRDPDDIVDLTGVTALKFVNPMTDGNRWYQSIHIYGTPTAANPERLAIWHPTLDQIATGSDLDFGAVAADATSTITFRVKNQSAENATESIVVSGDPDIDASAEAVVTFSDDDVTYGTSVSIGNLAAGAISSVVYAKYTQPTTPLAGPRNVRIQAVGSAGA